MDAGRMAVAADPGGAVFGIWQARSHIGFGLANEPGSVVWNENMSREFDQNRRSTRPCSATALGHPLGRMAILTDDQGAVFAAMSQSAASQG